MTGTICWIIIDKVHSADGLVGRKGPTFLTQKESAHAARIHTMYFGFDCMQTWRVSDAERRHFPKNKGDYLTLPPQGGLTALVKDTNRLLTR